MPLYKSENTESCDPASFDEQLQRLNERINALQRASGSGTSEELNRLTLAELSNALEEMRTASEEIRRQRNELREVHGDLEHERQRYKELFDAAPIAYLVTNAYGRIHEANQAATIVLDSRRDFLRGSPLGRYIAADCRVEFRDRLVRFAASPAEMPQTWETTIERRTHSPVEAELTVARNCDDGRDKLLWTIRDVTARKQLQRQVQQSERLAALGQMVASFAHESGNSLQRSQAALELLGRCIADRPEALKFVAEVERANDDLVYLQKCIKDYSSPVRLTKCPADLSDILEKAWSELHLELAGRNAALTQQGQTRDLICEIDPTAIEQVFRNVLENSLAACSDPVAIEATWTVCQLDGEPAVRIQLQDNGPGFSSAARERIFEPFFSTRAKGMGLGMSIVRRIVEAHGGQVHVDPESKRGAAIIIEIPKVGPWSGGRGQLQRTTDN